MWTIGPFLDLFTAGRYCFTCVASSHSLSTLPAKYASSRLELNSETMRNLPMLLSIPPFDADVHGPMLLSRTPTGLPIRRRYVRTLSASAATSIQNHELAIDASHPRSEPLVMPPEYLQKCHRFETVVRHPFLNQRVGELDWGVSCEACCDAYINRGRYAGRNTLYSAAGYLEHFQTCERSQISLGKLRVVEWT